MRDDILTSLVERALKDENFRQAARADLEGTLQQHGYDVTEDELQALRVMQAQTADWSDAELTERLSVMAREGVDADVVAHG
jgi:Ribosomally synthesized peptide prototyped by Frankia Franean1_4349.